MIELKQLKRCPFCKHPRSRMMQKRECCEEKDGTVAIRYAFYRRCNKCGATSPVVRTHSVTCAWYNQDAEWTKEYRDQVDDAWNRRADECDRDELLEIAKDLQLRSENAETTTIGPFLQISTIRAATLIEAAERIRNARAVKDGQDGME